MKAGEDIGVAIQHNDDWYWLDVEDPANLKYVQAPDGWLPRPKSPEEAERLASEAEAWASEPQREIQRELAALVAHRDSIQARIAALDAEEQAEQRRAEQEQQTIGITRPSRNGSARCAASCQGATHEPCTPHEAGISARTLHEAHHEWNHATTVPSTA